MHIVGYYKGFSHSPYRILPINTLQCNVDCIIFFSKFLAKFFAKIQFIFLFSYNPWLMSCLSQWPSEPAYYIEDCCMYFNMYLSTMFKLQYFCSLLEKEMICSSAIEIQFPMSFFCERTSKLQCRTIDMKQKYPILNEMVQWAIHIKYKCHVLSEISAFLCLRLLSIIMP